MLTTYSTLLPGRFFVRHVKPIGSGGLATVDQVLVTQSNSKHRVGSHLARKRLGAQWQNDAGAQGRFEREIEMLDAMNHPNIVSLEGVSLSGENWYVMPLFRSGSLRGFIQTGGSLGSIQNLTLFVAKIADALNYAHAMNFIHRDLKPENILISDAGEPVVADWGLGQFIHQHSLVVDFTQGGPMGTGYYCSLEQWSTGRCDVTGDVYSLGVVLAELAAGRAIPITPIGSGIRQDVVSGNTVAAMHLNALIKKMTAFAPATRPQTMIEVSAALRRIANLV